MPKYVCMYVCVSVKDENFWGSAKIFLTCNVLSVWYRVDSK